MLQDLYRHQQLVDLLVLAELLRPLLVLRLRQDQQRAYLLRAGEVQLLLVDAVGGDEAAPEEFEHLGQAHGHFRVVLEPDALQAHLNDGPRVRPRSPGS